MLHNLPLSVDTIVGIIGLLVPVAGLAWKYGRRVGHWLVARMMVPQSVAMLRADVAAILAELRPNGGGSLRDELSRLATDVTWSTCRTKELVEESSLPRFEADPQGEFIFVNDAYCTFTGRDADGLLGYNWKNTIEPSDRARVVEAWMSARTDGRTFDEVFRVAGAGALQVVRAVAQPVTNAGGHVVGYIGKLYPAT